MPVSSRKVEHVYRLLAEREAYRAQCSQLNSSLPSPEQVFYSVRNSVKHRYDNRYSNIYAYDRTAVVVEGEYLNANVVTDEKGGQWIAAQAPTPPTFDTFFRALYSGAALGKIPKTAILVQLTSWTERGVIKADPYMEHIMGGLKLHIDKRTRLDNLSSDLTEMTLEGDSRVALRHYHFDAWPDHGVPEGQSIDALLELVGEIEEQRKSLGCEVWVHCSAGVGRTGAFIALSSLRTPGLPPPVRAPIPPLPKELENDVIARTVDTIRECRGMLVQNPSQLDLLYAVAGRIEASGGKQDGGDRCAIS